MNQQRSITTTFVRILPAFVLAVLGGWPGVGVLADDCPDVRSVQNLLKVCPSENDG